MNVWKCFVSNVSDLTNICYSWLLKEFMLSIKKPFVQSYTLSHYVMILDILMQVFVTRLISDHEVHTLNL